MLSVSYSNHSAAISQPIFTAIPSNELPGESKAKSKLIENIAEIHFERIARAYSFIEALEQSGRSLGVQDVKSLNRFLTLMMRENNLAIHVPLMKEKGYLGRLLSNESWDEWFESKTQLGKVVSLFADFVESTTPLENYVRRLNSQIIEGANQESQRALSQPIHPKQKVSSAATAACAESLALGAIGSLATQSPVPLSVASLTCIRGAEAGVLDGHVGSLRKLFKQSGNAGLVGNVLKSIYSPGDYFFPLDSLNDLVNKVGQRTSILIQEAGSEAKGVTATVEKAANGVVLNMGKEGRLTIEKFGEEVRITSDEVLSKFFAGSHMLIQACGIEARLTIQEFGKEVRLTMLEVPRLAGVTAEMVAMGFLYGLKVGLFGLDEFRHIHYSLYKSLSDPSRDFSLLDDLEYVYNQQSITPYQKSILYRQLLLFANNHKDAWSKNKQKFLMIGAVALEDEHLAGSHRSWANFISSNGDYRQEVVSHIQSSEVREMLISKNMQEIKKLMPSQAVVVQGKKPDIGPVPPPSPDTPIPSSPNPIDKSVFKLNMDAVLKSLNIRTEEELRDMSEDDKRNTLIVEISKRTSSKIPDLQKLANHELTLKLAFDAVLKGLNIRTEKELRDMSEDDKRNTLIVEISKRISSKIPDLQKLNNHELILRIGMIVTLKSLNIRTEKELRNMSEGDIRNTLIVEISKRKSLEISYLQGLNNHQLIKIIL